MIRGAVCVLIALAVGGCMRWRASPQPAEAVLSAERAQDVAVRLEQDSTRWFVIREARLAGDSIVGVSRAHGRTYRVAMALDDVLQIATRESNEEANSGLNQALEFAALLAAIALIPVAFVAFAGR